MLPPSASAVSAAIARPRPKCPCLSEQNGENILSDISASGALPESETTTAIVLPDSMDRHTDIGAAGMPASMALVIRQPAATVSLAVSVRISASGLLQIILIISELSEWWSAIFWRMEFSRTERREGDRVMVSE